MNEQTLHLLELIRQNPDLPVVPLVWSEGNYDDYAWYIAKWGDACVGEYAAYSERIYTDRDDLKEDYLNYNDEDFDGLTEDEIEAKLDEITAPYWVNAIIVDIDPL